MEFLIGLVVGWFSAPYFLFGTLWFLVMFPVLFFGTDIYDDRHTFRFTGVFICIGATLLVMHVFTEFNALSLITGGFWISVLNLWGYVIAYFGIGILYALLVRWPIYARNYARRYLGDKPSEAKLKEFYDNKRLDRKGSRLKLIMKWILYWPWSLLAWTLTELLGDVFDALVEFVIEKGRAFFGGMFASIARATEPKDLKDYRRKREAEDAARAAAKATDDRVMTQSGSRPTR